MQIEFNRNPFLFDYICVYIEVFAYLLAHKPLVNWRNERLTGTRDFCEGQTSGSCLL